MNDVNLWGLVAALVVVAGLAVIGVIREGRRREEEDELKAALDRMYPPPKARRELASAAAKMQTRDANGRFVSGEPGTNPAAKNAE